MEFFFVVIPIIVIFTIKKIISEAIFKDKVITILNQAGIPNQEANNIYLVHKKFIKKSIENGLSLENITQCIAGEIKHNRLKLMSNEIKNLYKSSHGLAQTLLTNKKGLDFLDYIGSFLQYIEANHNHHCEKNSKAFSLIKAIKNKEYNTAKLIENNLIRELQSLSEEDATVCIFKFFWPKLILDIEEDKYRSSIANWLNLD